MKKQKGFVLLAVLLLIQIAALLGISALDQVILEQKLLSDTKIRRLLLNAAENQLTRLTAAIKTVSETCRIPGLSVAELRSRPLSWWSLYSCAEETSFFKYYYVVENLGTDPCAQLRGEESGPAAYYRLTVLLMQKADPRQKVMLQSTVVTESANLERCDARPHSVDWGPQSWHELI